MEKEPCGVDLTGAIYGFDLAHREASMLCRTYGDVDLVPNRDSNENTFWTVCTRERDKR